MIQETTAKSILRQHKKIDSWFVSSYGINLYRGCMHNCVYCDGRDEKYQVEGEFGRDIVVKSNAIDLLQKELDPDRKRKPFSGGFFVVCGGVSDSYQPYEKKMQLTRQTLELLHRYRHPVHMLTKSTLIERDLDLIQQINEQSKAIVSFSFSSVDDRLSKLLEPNVPSPSERLATIRKFKNAGISCGMYLMPVVPFITDNYEMIERSVAAAKDAGVDFIIFGGMTLKPGRQKEYFMDFIQKHFPELKPKYEALYGNNNEWGAPDYQNTPDINKMFGEIATRLGVPKRIPASLFESIVTTNEFVVLILDQLDYLAKLKGYNSPYGYASYVISQLDQPIENMNREELLQLKGVGNYTAKLIQEIIQTKQCSYYKSLL